MLPKNLRQALTGLPALCQGRADHLRDWLENPTGGRLAACAVALVLGGACYGFTLGLWRAPLMGGYVAFKLPLLIALTLLTNGLINGMLAQVLGSGLTFRQTLMALLMSSAAWAYVAKMAMWKKVVLFLSAFPLAILGNSLRVISIFVIAEYGDAHWARTTWHDWSGLLLFYPFSLALLLVIHSVLEGGVPWKKGGRRTVSRVMVTQTGGAGPS